MRANFIQDVIDETPEDVKIYMRWYSDLAKKVNACIKKRGITQKELALAMGKKPSELNRWLNGEHNFTLKSLAKLQAELKIDLIEIKK